jgi:prolyl-tRNA editing enzyme YbaK/EbsC (Cys-tRNA(Pro) deacylase)
MAIPAKTKKYLDQRLAKYDALSHRTVYTAYDLAQTLKRELKEIGKSLLIAADRAYVIVVVPAHMRVDLKKLKKSLGAKKVSIPKESVMVKIFKVKPGALTAFGGLHNVEVVVDKSFDKAKDMIVGAGTFTDSVRVRVKDFIQMEQAKLADVAQRAGYKLQVKPKTKSKAVKKRPVKKKSGQKSPAVRPKSKRKQAIKRIKKAKGK